MSKPVSFDDYHNDMVSRLRQLFDEYTVKHEALQREERDSADRVRRAAEERSKVLLTIRSLSGKGPYKVPGMDSTVLIVERDGRLYLKRSTDKQVIDVAEGGE